MSSENFQIDRISSVLLRVKLLSGLSKDYQLADLFGLSSGDFSKRKSKGTLIFVILNWALANNQDLNYIFYGTEGPPPSDKRILAAYKILEANNDLSEIFSGCIEAFSAKIGEAGFDED